MGTKGKYGDLLEGLAGAAAPLPQPRPVSPPHPRVPRPPFARPALTRARHGTKIKLSHCSSTPKKLGGGEGAVRCVPVGSKHAARARPCVHVCVCVPKYEDRGGGGQTANDPKNEGVQSKRRVPCRLANLDTKAVCHEGARRGCRLLDAGRCDVGVHRGCYAFRRPASARTVSGPEIRSQGRG